MGMQSIRSICTTREMLLIQQCGHAGQFPALKKFERRAAARGDVRHLLGDARLLDRAGGIAAADDGHRIGLREEFCQRKRAFGKLRHFEHANRSIPDDEFRARQRGL